MKTGTDPSFIPDQLEHRPAAVQHVHIVLGTRFSRASVATVRDREAPS